MSQGWVDVGKYSSSLGQTDYYEDLPPVGESKPPGKAIPSQDWRAVDSGIRTKKALQLSTYLFFIPSKVLKIDVLGSLYYPN